MNIPRAKKQEIELILEQFLKDNVDLRNPARVGFSLKQIVDDVIFEFSSSLMPQRIKKEVNVFDGSELL